MLSTSFIMTDASPKIQTRVACFTGTLHTATPSGHIETIYGMPSYISRGMARTNSTIIFLTDGFGFNLVNNKLLADQYATRTGLRVLMPNVLPGGGVPLIMMTFLRTTRTTLAWWKVQGHAKRAWTALRLLAILMPFTVRVRLLYPAVLRYVHAVKASLPLGSRLGVAGFCLGGCWSSRLCGETAAGGGNLPLIDAHFTAHPSSVNAEEMVGYAAKFHVPFSLALGDRDRMVTTDEAHRVETGLKEVFRDEPDKLQVRIYERCGHGFALRADPHEMDENEGAERALEQAVTWFRRYLS